MKMSKLKDAFQYVEPNNGHQNGHLAKFLQKKQRYFIFLLDITWDAHGFSHFENLVRIPFCCYGSNFVNFQIPGENWILPYNNIQFDCADHQLFFILKKTLFHLPRNKFTNN